MRWFVGITIVLVLFMLLYLGSAASSLASLAQAARDADGTAILQKTDMKALRHSLTDQVVRVYLERIGAIRRISPLEKTLVNTYGATVADAMVAKMLTPDKLSQLLKNGKIEGAPELPSFAGMPPLAELHTDNWFSLLGRINFINPVLLGIRISETSDPDSYAAINLHAEGLNWKLAGIELPRKVARDLAASLPLK